MQVRECSRTACHVSSRVSRVDNGKFSVHYNSITDAFSMASQSEKRTEDLESPSSQASVASKDENVSIVASSDPGPDRDESTKPKLASSTSTTNGKRQRTLFDMIGGSAPSQGSNTLSKKPKLTASSGSSGNAKLSAVSSSGGSSGMQPLNSIPFSLSEYIDSLTGDQKRLLRLECETMGKSW